MKTYFLNAFPACCRDLDVALKKPESGNFFINNEGQLCLNVGRGTDQALQKTIFYDMPLSFCPFCGQPLPSMQKN